MRREVELLEELPGRGPLVERHVYCGVRIRLWLHPGDPIRWKSMWGLYDRGRLEDDGSTLFTRLRVDREYMFAGLYYGVEGMRVGGTRRLRVAPHLAYRVDGVPGVVPPNAHFDVEIAVLSRRGTG